jgi:hypothetical protein
MASLLAREARVLGNKEDEENFDALAEQIRQAYNHKYFDPVHGHYANSSQTSQALPIFTGLVATDSVRTTAEALVTSVHAAGDHLRTGFVGLLPLMSVLGQSGKEDLAYTIANQGDVPGWWSMIRDGGTTVTEYWDPHTGTRNLINLAGPLGTWFYETVAGIRLDPSCPGYKRLILKPGPIGNLTFANASIQTIHGKVESSWRLDGSKLLVEVSIPANTTATLFLPVPATANVQEMDGDSSGINRTVSSAIEQKWARELGSGTYHFEVAYTH